MSITGGDEFKSDEEYHAAVIEFAHCADTETIAFRRFDEKGGLHEYIKYKDSTKEFLVIGQSGNIRTYYPVDIEKVRQTKQYVDAGIKTEWDYFIYKLRK